MTFVERCLYEYKANKAAIEAISMEINDLMSVRGCSYENYSPDSHTVSDSVLEVTAMKMNLEKKIVRLQRLTTPVEKLRDDLSGNSLNTQQMREILVWKYIEHEGNERTQEKMAVSERTFWRRVRELLYLAKKYFGEVN